MGPELLLLLAVVLGIYALLGKPLFAVLGGAAVLTHLWGTWDSFEQARVPLQLDAIFIEAATIVDGPYYIAIPLFVFAGTLLAESGAPERLVRLARALFGWLPGGLAIVATVTCAFFTAFTGASGVTIVALGGLLYPVLRRERYPDGFSIGLLTTGGSLGLLFPPSLPLIVYGLIAGVDVDKLFVAGILPGLLLVAVLSGYGMLVGKLRGVERTRLSLGAIGPALRAAAFELPIPVLILVGIYGGYVTATEASAVVALYCLVVEVFVLRDIGARAFVVVVRKTAELVGAILIILIMALGLKNYLVYAEVPQQLLALMKSHIHSPLTFLLVLNVFLIAVGCLLDIFSAILVVVPLVAPLAHAFGVDPIHLGIIFLTNLEIGYLTPPVGINLFLGGLRFERPILEVARHVLPFLGLLVLCLVVITYVPSLSLLLVHWSMGAGGP
ncbi:MAG: TRAP transporter large permease [Planctomycetota bacterium]|nr:MAG: TRAP transporter large permease [Planctomycetota bacterium]